jgi:hypothetical protein
MCRCDPRFGQGKPALSLHDAILCKESDAELAKESMHEVYSLMYDFAPEIEADWPLPDARK